MTRTGRGGARTDDATAGKAGYAWMESAAFKEVRAVKRFALLATGGALWLLLAVTPVFADGGPHQLANNNGTGTSGLAGDCAACHRAHTAQAADLLKAELPDLCLSCHNGTGATADVVDGVQYTPDTDGTPTTTVLGALRGGGFDYALIGTPSRLSYASRGSIAVNFASNPASGTITLTWPAFTGFAGGPLTFLATSTQADIQTAADSVFGTSTTYSGSGAANMGTTYTSNMLVTKDGATGNVTFAPQNALRLVGSTTEHSIPAPTVTTNTTGVTATVVNGISIGGAGKIGVLTTGAATTSNHMAGNGVVWGNGAQGIGTTGATGVVLDCAKCHNPHGNGQYRILQTQPGEDWATTAPSASTTLALATTNLTSPITVAASTGFPGSGAYVIKIDSEYMQVTAGQGTTAWTVTRGYAGTTAASHLVGAAVSWVNYTAPALEVKVADAAPATLTAGQVRNYTVRPSTTGLTTGIVGAASDGDYWRYKYDTSGVTNFTNFYLKSDPMNSGWAGTTASYATLTNGSGAMTAWCVQCHTRYNGYRTGTPASPSSLTAQTPTDATFMYKHGTTNIGCEQCHVSHGSNRVMVPGTASADVAWPGAGFLPGTGDDDSRLLKVNNRGTCQLCHDPTGTVYAGLTVGTVPGAIKPGP